MAIAKATPAQQQELLRQLNTVRNPYAAAGCGPDWRCLRYQDCCA